MKIKSLKINVVINLFRTFLSMVFPLITFPYITRVLGPENLGKINYSQSIISYFSILAGLGISSYGVREAAKLRDKKEDFSGFVLSLFKLNLISTAVAYIFLIICMFTVPKFFDYRKLMIILSSSIFFTVIGIDWIYSALEDFFYITVRSFIFQIISITLLFFFVKSPGDYYKYAFILITSSCGSSICNFVHARKFISLRTATHVPIKTHLTPVFIMFGMAVTASIFTTLDTTMVGMMSGDTQVGFYSVGVKCVSLLKGLIIVLSSTLLPRVSYLYENDKSEFENLFIKGFQVTLFLALIVSALLFINAEFIVKVLAGGAYSVSISCLKILASVLLFSSVSLVIDNQLFIPMRYEKLNLIGVIIGAVTDFILNLLLIPRYGAVGACIGTLFAEFTMMIYHIIFVKKKFKDSHMFVKIKHYLIPIALILICCIFEQIFKFNIEINILFSIVLSFVYVLYFSFCKESVVRLYIKRILRK